MIVAMLDIDRTKESILLVVIEDCNMRRMELADPMSLGSLQHGGRMPVPKYPQAFSLVVAYEKDSFELYRRVREDTTVDLLRWLERGRTFPEDGNAFMIQKGILRWPSAG